MKKVLLNQQLYKKIVKKEIYKNQPLVFESGAAASACEAPAAATGGGGESPLLLWGEEVDLATFESADAEIEKAFLLEAAQLEQTQQALLTRHESDATRDFDAALRDLEDSLVGRCARPTSANKNKNLRGSNKKYNENIQNKQKTKTFFPGVFLA